MLDMEEMSEYKTKILGSNTGGPAVITFNRYYDMARLAGVSKRQYMYDDDYRGTWNTNPNEVLKVDLFNQATSTGGRTVYYDLRIIYYAQCMYANDVTD